MKLLQRLQLTISYVTVLLCIIIIYEDVKQQQQWIEYINLQLNKY